MSASPPIVLPVSLPEAFAALQDHRLIELCTPDVRLGSAMGDGVIRSHLTHAQGNAELTYQLSMRVVEACADDHRIRYQLQGRETEGGSLAALTLDATLSVVDAQTLLTLTPHLVLAGRHGGIPYPDLQVASTRAVEASSKRIAELLSDPHVLSSISSPSEGDGRVAHSGPTGTRPRTLAAARTKEAVLVIASAVGLCCAGYAFLRRSRRSS